MGTGGIDEKTHAEFEWEMETFAKLFESLLVYAYHCFDPLLSKTAI